MKQNLSYRPTWAEIDLSALRFNYMQLMKFTKPGTEALAAVKADAYGHGAVMVSRVLGRCPGIRFLGVASSDEALWLRRNRIKLAILILGVINSRQEIKEVIKNNITPTITSLKAAVRINNIAQRLGKIVKVHLKIDTGMGRIGFWHEDAGEIVPRIDKLKNIKIEGIYTHLSCADIDKRFTLQQIERFHRLVNMLEGAGVYIELKHAANSIGLCNYPESHFNLVRPGIMLYGMYPKQQLCRRLKLKPVLSLHTRIAYLKKVLTGRAISYKATFVTKGPANIATLPIGYADGYRRELSNHGRVIIRGKYAKIRGLICMDQTMVELKDIPNVREWDEVVLIGKNGKCKITAEELAGRCGTIPYEITCGISQRVPRYYRDD
ncbi:MAG: alanine racemase [Candidatus Omnitrophota bacterium]